jgi:hypothetical protein
MQKHRLQRSLAQRILGGVFALVLGSSALLYAQAVQQKIEFYLDGKVGTELVKKGNYTLSFPDADQGTLEIKVGKKTVTAPFTRRPLAIESEADRITYRDNGDGTRSIATITPRGRKYTLALQ